MTLLLGIRSQTKLQPEFFDLVMVQDEKLREHQSVNNSS